MMMSIDLYAIQRSSFTLEDERLCAVIATGASDHRDYEVVH
jgi:hypothetical protein